MNLNKCIKLFAVVTLALPIAAFSQVGETLAIALAAKASNSPIRIDYTKGVDGVCNGYAIFVR